MKRLSMRYSLTSNTYCSGALLALARENCLDTCRKHKIDMPMEQQCNRRPSQSTSAPKQMVQDLSMNAAASILLRRHLHDNVGFRTCGQNGRTLIKKHRNSRSHERVQIDVNCPSPDALAAQILVNSEVDDCRNRRALALRSYLGG